MLELLALVVAFPLAGFAALLVGRALPRRAVAAVGAGSVALAFMAAVAVAVGYHQTPGPAPAYVQTLWTWIAADGLDVRIAFRLDALSLLMVLVVTGVGFLIHLYSTAFMAGQEGYGRFFAYMNLFVASMLVLVLADNLLLLYLGWEGVGLCSFLLIGFWYKNAANGRAAMKAFVVTRVGDAAMAVGLFLLFANLGTLNIQELLRRAAEHWPVGSGLAVAAAALLLAGAVGKSAQLPLQTWLPDAMAGPTPVSALIHAATMVTAGVYLIARAHVLFELAPAVQFLVAVVGAVTLLLAGFSALVQRDIKRVLAYSTISQLGYMFLALGVGAYSAAMFHFMTHAFFKSLLFLAAGAVILAMHDEHDMFKLGGLARKLPLVFWTFLVGAASLSALPLVTAGFYSKDLVLSEVLASEKGGLWLWLAGLAGALLTALYSFRMVFITFFGPARQEPVRRPGLAMALPLVVLAALSIVGGWVAPPSVCGSTGVSPVALDGTGETPVLPDQGTLLGATPTTALAGAVGILGILAAWWLFLRRPATAEKLAATPIGSALHRLWFAGWGFDWLYDRLLVRPLVWLARVNRADFIDWFYRGVGKVSLRLHRGLSLTVNGQVRWYAAGLAIGAIVILALVVLL